MDESACVIHYKNITFSDKLTPVSQKSFASLYECKAIRQKLGGDNRHDDQCKKLPDSWDEGLKIYYHRECYQKFVYARTLLKRKASEDVKAENVRVKSLRRRDDNRGVGEEEHVANPRGLFPQICMICKKEGRIQVNRKRDGLSKILTKSAEHTLKEAALLRNDQEMLTAITDIDLIAKEFQKHSSCYKDYTRVVSKIDTASDSCNKEGTAGNFGAVCSLVEENVLEDLQCVSIDTLLTSYGLGVGDRQRRLSLKERLKGKYHDKLVFVSPEYHSPQVVFSKECMETQSMTKTLEFSDEYVVKKAAVKIRHAILEIIKDAAPLPWPPTVDSLQSEERRPPSLLKFFFKTLFSSDSHHPIGERIERIVMSLSDDISMSLNLPLHPADEGSKVSTIFWWDNFDRNIETSSGSGSIHNTPGIVFQEASEACIKRSNEVSIPMSKRRSLPAMPAEEVSNFRINPKTEPPKLASNETSSSGDISEGIAPKLLTTWKLARYLNSEDQNTPRFVGWVINHFKKNESQPTTMTYMPPIETPITDYATFVKITDVIDLMDHPEVQAFTKKYTDLKADSLNGGVTKFAAKPQTITKWVLSRPFQSTFVEALREISGTDSNISNPRKCLRPSEILKTNKVVQKIQDALTNQFINPFDEQLDNGKLYNIVSGCPTNDEISESLLSLEKQGEEMMTEFVTRFTESTQRENGEKDKFFSPIKKNKIKTFQDGAVKKTVKRGNKIKEVAFQRDVLGLLVANSNKKNAGIDLDAVLCYPLAPVSIPLSTPDGSIRKTVKSKLYSAAMSDLEELTYDDFSDVADKKYYFLDLAAAIRTIVGNAGTIRDLAAKVMATIPQQYVNVYVACDTYLENSIKSRERAARGAGERYVLRTPDMKVPADFVTFLKNGDNKKMLFNLIQQSIEDDRHNLNDRVIYFSNATQCSKISKDDARPFPESRAFVTSFTKGFITAHFSPSIDPIDMDRLTNSTQTEVCPAEQQRDYEKEVLVDHQFLKLLAMAELSFPEVIGTCLSIK
eukprot:gene2237-2552_t